MHQNYTTEKNPYKLLAERLDALPNGFPPTDDGAELHLLAKLFTVEEAELAAQLRMTLETSTQIAQRLGRDPESTQQLLKGMTRKGLIKAGRGEDGLGYGLMPFVVGIYEMQVHRLDDELARLFENYYQRSFNRALTIQPAIHRVIPVAESVRMDMEIRPFESAADIVANAKAWGVMDCICRKQKALINDPCDHPLDVCMIMSKSPNAFDNQSQIRALTQDEAMGTLRRAAEAGLVHSVSNSQKGVWYVCNCCTCSCGILRGMAELGIANVVARSSFVNQVEEALCVSCGDCIDMCQFKALALGEFAEVNETRCTGCGVCVLACPENALSLILRPTEDVKAPPETEKDWMMARAKARGLDINKVL